MIGDNSKVSSKISFDISSKSTDFLKKKSEIDYSMQEFTTMFHNVLIKIRDELLISFSENPTLIKPSNDLYEFLKDETLLELKDENFLLQASEMGAFYLLNKIFYYEFIRQQVRESHAIKLPQIYSSKLSESLPCQVLKNFKILEELFEVAPIFSNNPYFKILEVFPSFNNVIAILSTFISEISRMNFLHLQVDFLGNFFQELLPGLDRKLLGQIYTPPEIAKLMVELAIRSPNDTVLDPACGCGSLLLQSYRRLNKLKDQNISKSSPNSKEFLNSFHNHVLNQLWGIEINPFPAHISMLSLSLLNLSSITDSVGIFLEDFLKLGPLKTYIVKSKNLQNGHIITRVLPSFFDVVIANPPYIKQEKIPNKKEMMCQLPLFASQRVNFQKKRNFSGEIPSKKRIKLGLTGKTDYYGFFLWYATYFLKEGGRLCFILPNKWMDVKYGEKLKEFLLANYKINAIIGFDQNVFPKAQVSTVILLADRCNSATMRKSTEVQFLRLQSPKVFPLITKILKSRDQDAIIPSNEGESFSGSRELTKHNRIQKDFHPNLHNITYIFDNSISGISRTIIRQKFLDAEEKWSMKYLFQSRFARFLSQCDLLSLDNGIFTRVVGGIKTGANAFFFPSSELIEQFCFPSHYLKPGIRSGRNLPDTFIINSSIDLFVSIPPELNSHESPEISAYIKYGEEKEKYPKRPSLHWKPWYAIPESQQDSPDILFLRHIGKNFRAFWNKIGAIVADGIRGIKVLDSKWLYFLLGLCNSTFFYWQAHMLGRWEGQGDLQLLVYELRRFVIPNLNKISDRQKSRVVHAMKSILSNSPRIDQVSLSQQESLDRAVLACFDLEGKYDLLVKETLDLERKRINKGKSE
ncbi:MAG: HsdM family class I SAM-dependent methyltransferase [Promethearchaeota archaeon]